MKVRWVAAVLCAAVGSFAGLVACLGASMVPASAAVKYLRVVPAQGSLDTAINLELPTGAFCPAEAQRVIVRMTGPGLQQPFNATGNTDIVALDVRSKPGTTIFPLIWTWRDAGGNVEPAPIEFDGVYRITLSCLVGLSLDTLGDTIADVEISQASNSYRVLTPQPIESTGSASASDGVVTPDSGVATQSPGVGEQSQGAGDPPVDEVPDAGSAPSPGGLDDSASGAGGAPATGDADGGAGADQVDAGQQQASNSQPAPAEDSGGRTLLIAAGILLIALAVYFVWKGRRQSV